jgi:hypothetical protein
MKNLDTMRKALIALAEDKPIIANVDGEAIIRLDSGEGAVIADCNFRMPPKHEFRLHKWWTWPAVGAVGLAAGIALGRGKQ